MSEVSTVNLYVSKLLEDLAEGLSWLKKDDVGYGSIEEKYNAKEKQIDTIRKHPGLKDVNPSLTRFVVIDDRAVGEVTLDPIGGRTLHEHKSDVSSTINVIASEPTKEHKYVDNEVLEEDSRKALESFNSL